MNAPESFFTPANDRELNGYIPFDLADFYKTGHPPMYPKGTTKLVANFTPRSDKYSPVKASPFFDGKVVWVGLQGFIKEFLVDTFKREFFGKPKAIALRKYKRRMDTSLGNGKVSTDKLSALWDLGYLPLEIRSIPEGSRVDIKVTPVLFISTNDDFAFVATYFETLISCEMWKPATVATIAFEFRKILTYFAELTGAPLDFVMWQAHDFSMRGMSGVHDAMRCGMGHLLSFYGTDTIPAIDYIEDYYGADADTEIIGGSIPATEHSVMALRILYTVKQMRKNPAYDGLDEKAIRREAEYLVVKELITEDYPDGMISSVSDTFDFWNMVRPRDGIVARLKNEILARGLDENGMAKVVIRPDSGDPVMILTGYTWTEVRSASVAACREALRLGYEAVFAQDDGKFYRLENGNVVETPDYVIKGAVECLWETFGGAVTDKGYRVLNPRVGLIYGDSITIERAIAIIKRLIAKGFASCNVVFGVGSFTYNLLSRDSFSWAMKAIYAMVNGESVDIYKDPATDDGTKKSAKGMLRVEKEGDKFVQYEQQTWDEAMNGQLQAVWRDGDFLRLTKFSEMRQTLWSSMPKLSLPQYEEMLKMAA